MAQEALQKLRIGLRRWPRNGYLSLLTANLEAKTGNVGPARRLYAVAAAHSTRSTIALQVVVLVGIQEFPVRPTVVLFFFQVLQQPSCSCKPSCSTELPSQSAQL